MSSSSENGLSYNVKRYHYVGGTQVRLYSRPLKKGLTREIMIDDNSEVEQSIEEIEEKKRKSKMSSRNRTVQSIYGIARANRWDLFLTLTFDRNLVDSSDYGVVTNKASKWCNNLKSRVSPNMKYILVPELHSDGKHWHIHGLFSDCPELQLFKTDIVKNGKIIYNLSNWKYGFSTATVVEHTGKVSSYITKYITKELCERSKGKRRYWASKNCLRADDVLEIDCMTTDEVEEYIKDISDDIQHMKTQICRQSGQIVKFIELGD